MNQQTIGKSVSISGVGLHTGVNSTVILHPANVNHGIKFNVKHGDTDEIIPAQIAKVSNTNRSTKLTSNNVDIQTVEHLLAALYAMRVTNILVEVNANELPILDGSSKVYIEAIEEAGIVDQEVELQRIKIREPFEYVHEPTGSRYTVLPSEAFEVHVNIDFNSKVLPCQFAELKDLESFPSEIASCRTFVFLHDILALHKHGLIKGGHLDNAVIVVENLPEKKEAIELKNAFPDAGLDIDRPGLVAKNGLKYPNELSRHKLLDFLGDIALCGTYFDARIIVNKPSHEANTAFAKVFKEVLKSEQKNKLVPVVDFNADPVYDINQIYDVLPHRYPFLLVDKIVELTESRVVGYKNITMNEPFFQGHFPNNPIMPGVLQIEAMAQTGGILAISLLPPDKKYDTYFLKIDNCKFKAKVIPGDTLVITMDLLEPIRRGICKMQGRAFVGNTLVTEAELTAQLVPRDQS